MKPNKDTGVRACPFQKGDYVMTPKGAKVVTAVGFWFFGVLYRTDKRDYWSEWQLRRVHKRRSRAALSESKQEPK